MTFDEALTTLELEAGSSPSEREVRAAYVRLVKVHKPERDPTGFQAIREAYEIARRGRVSSLALRLLEAPGGLELVEAPRETRDQPSAREDEPVEGDAGPELAPAQPGPPPTETPIGAPSGPLPLAIIDPALARIYEELDAAPDSDARLAVLLRGVAACPRAADLRWELYDHYLAIGESGAARRTLRDGLALELPGFLEELAQQHPEEIEPRQIAALEDRGQEVLAARVWLARDEAARAEAALDRALERAARPEAGVLSRGTWLRVGIAAMADGQTALAARIAHAVKDRAELFTPAVGTQVQEALLRGLLDAAPHLRPDVTRILALEVDARDGSQPLSTLGEGDPALAARTLRVLEQHAPTLAHTLGPRLGRRGGEASPARPSQVPWHGLLMVVFLLVQGSRTCTASTGHPAPTYMPPSVARQLERPHLPPPLELPSRPEPAPGSSPWPSDRTPITSTVERICETAPDHCVAATRASARAMADDCTEGLVAVAELEHDCGLSDARDLCRELAILVASRCEARLR